jgi:hypothetical protein
MCTPRKSLSGYSFFGGNGRNVFAFCWQLETSSPMFTSVNGRFSKSLI